MRSLIWVPIVHSAEDLGGLRDSVQETCIRRRGQAQWDAHLKSVNDLWKEIQLMTEGLGLDWAGVRLYQDGLPVCDHEEAIVRELAEKGSANHRLLVDLIDRGARLTGTESPQLLIDEYALNRRILGVSEPVTTQPPARLSPQIQRQAKQLLDQRDQFIAARIAQTLETHEQGLIFLGALHSLKGRLARDIQLSIIRPGDRQARQPDPTR